MPSSLNSRLKDKFTTTNIASPTADEMIPYSTAGDVYARDPLTRLRALEDTEGIKDASGPLVANSMMLASPAGAPVSTYLNTLKSLLDLHHVISSGAVTANRLGNSATSLASPFASTIIRALRSKFNLPEVTLPK